MQQDRLKDLPVLTLLLLSHATEEGKQVSQQKFEQIHISISLTAPSNMFKMLQQLPTRVWHFKGIY